MQELIEAIKAWPVIVQGALGSALFWLVLLIGQKVTIAAAEAYSRHSKASRINWLTTAGIKYHGAIENNTGNAIALLYRSSRDLYKGIMWLALGLAIQSLLDISGIIGFAGCVYYLLKAYSVVSPLDKTENWKERLQKINDELSKLQKI